MEVAERTVNEQEDACDLHYFKTLSMYVLTLNSPKKATPYLIFAACGLLTRFYFRLCDYAQVYEEYFTKGMEFVNAVKEEVEQQRKNIKEVIISFSLNPFNIYLYTSKFFRCFKCGDMGQ